ncbi:hypothetical protein U1Q18_043879, partial [Sarracenia purpurea var. burkii]
YSKVAALLVANTDTEALLSFKLTISDPKSVLSSWNTTHSHCAWLGVSCSNSTTDPGRVHSLHLSGLGLSGTLSPHLSNLTSLQTLDLSKNSLYGQIPPEFSRLSLLENLILTSNSITGAIPAILSRCNNLIEVNLGFNFHTGNLPPELGGLTRLEILDVSGNNLTGVIPPTFGNLSALSVLALARNQFSGTIPTELGALRRLLTIQLSENQFNGEVPISVFNISSLINFSIVENDFSGILPTDLGSGFPNIEQLYLGQNQFQGSIPELSNASKIQFLDLSTNQFQGPIPSLRKMNSLVLLNLGVNNLSSTTELNLKLFESLTNCTQLQSIILNSNQLAGELPTSIANLSTELENLCIDTNHFTGNFRGEIGKLQNLISISLHQNLFTGQISNSIGLLHKLQRMTLHVNKFSGEIPDVFGNLTELYFLTMGGNQLSGKIPLSIGSCKHLTTFGLANNNLVGSIPMEIFGFYSLNNLRLSHNSLTGSLPSELGGLTQLEFMDVSENQLSGNLSGTIQSCISMRNLSLSRNNFTGLIPNSVGKLVALESLDLSYNRFLGPIPEELGQLRHLQELNLSFNELEGPIPENGVFRNLGLDSFQGNYKLCGGRLGFPSCITGKKRGTRLSPKKIILVVVSSIIVLCAVICLMWALLSRKMNRKRKNRDISSPSVKGLPPKISYSDIHVATNGFSAENLIGKGSFGSVYKGVFGNRESLAVKVIDLHQSKALNSFNAECEALRNVRHRNLVRIITSCSSIDHKGNEFKALVMDFMANGNLDNWLHPREFDSELNLNLTQRLVIAIDVASAMDYLHHDCEPPLVHCDLKPANVLLDDNMGARLGDFGLARFLHPISTENKSSTVGLKGSIGYIAPGTNIHKSTNFFKLVFYGYLQIYDNYIFIK